MHLGKKVQLNIGGQPRIRGTLLAWVSTTNHDGEAAKNVLLGGVEYFNHFGEFWAPDSDASPCVVRAHSHLNNRKVVLV